MECKYCKREFSKKDINDMGGCRNLKGGGIACIDKHYCQERQSGYRVRINEEFISTLKYYKGEQV